MMRREFESRIGHTLSDNQWEVVDRIYNYHPEVPDKGGKDVVAAWYREAMSDRYPSFSRLVYTKLGVANDEAEKQGAARVRYLVPQWYGTEVVDEKRGLILETRMKSVREVYEYCANGLGDMVDEYFHIMPSVHKDRPWPNDRELQWIAVFPVTGGSEGHYVHVEAIYRDEKDPFGRRELLFLGKTFRGMSHAWNMCKRLGELLHV